MNTLLHVGSGVSGPAYAFVIAVGGLTGAVLLGLGIAAFYRRRSRSYLLIALALGTLFARASIGGAAVIGLVGSNAHHFGEHVLDVVMAGLVVAAVYYARTVKPEAAS